MKMTIRLTSEKTINTSKMKMYNRTPNGTDFYEDEYSTREANHINDVLRHLSNNEFGDFHLETITIVKPTRRAKVKNALVNSNRSTALITLKQYQEA